MKEKIKRFFLEKRELMVFLGVLAIIFTTVISVVTIALNESRQAGGDPVSSGENMSGLLPSIGSESNKGANATNPDIIEPTTISLPITGEYIIVRQYFDSSKSSEELVSAMINTGSFYVESKGISYAKEDNQAFEVNAIYPGKVTNVNYDEANGYTVTILHEEGLVSVYKSLSECNVEINQAVTSSTVLGMSGTRVYDTSAGVHVHVEVMLNDVYLNPTSIIGKEIEEVVSIK